MKTVQMLSLVNLRMIGREFGARLYGKVDERVNTSKSGDRREDD